MNSRKVRESTAAVATAALVIVAIPLVFGLVFFYRVAAFAAVGVGVVVLTAAVVVSPTVRGRFRSMVDPEVEYKGMRLATEVLLGPGHVWARVERDGAFVGIDDIAGKCLGTADWVDLPVPGQHVRHGELLFAVSNRDRRIESRSPVDGTILAANDQLRKDPERVNRDPYGLGWVVRLRNDEPGREKRRMLRGVEAKQWFHREVDRVVSLVGGAQGAQTLADGGVVAQGFDRMIDEPTWQRLRSEMFEVGRVSNEEVES